MSAEVQEKLWQDLFQVFFLYLTLALELGLFWKAFQ